MRYFFLLATIFLAACIKGPAPGELSLVNTGKKGLDSYWLYLPIKHKATKKYPVILFLGGGASTGPNRRLAKNYGPPLLTHDNEAPKKVRELVANSFIIISPHLEAGPKGEREWEQFTTEILNILDSVGANYGGDNSRVYITGLSKGAQGCWNVAKQHPERFAACAPVAGRLGCFKDCEALSSIPLWIFHNADDDVVPVQWSMDAVKTLEQENQTYFTDVPLVQALGSTPLEEKNLITIYPATGHDAWTRTYESADLYNWFLKQSKK